MAASPTSACCSKSASRSNRRFFLHPMKPSLSFFSSVVFTGSLLSLSAQEWKIEAVEPLEPTSTKPLILPYDDADEEPADEPSEDEEATDEEEVDATGDEEGAPDDWFPGKSELPDVIYTLGGDEDPEE